MRKAIIAGNWKMNNTIGESTELAKALAEIVKAADDREVVIAPVFTALPAVAATVQGSAAGGPAGLDAAVAQGIKSQPVVDERFAEELVAEMIGEVPVVARVNIALQFRRRHVDHLRRLRERVDAELFRTLVRKRPVKF